MRYNEKLVERHEKQLCDLVEATEKQTEELEKEKKEFTLLKNSISTLDNRVKRIEDELVEKRSMNGYKWQKLENSEQELKSLREMIIETNENVTYLKGLKDGEASAISENRIIKRENREEENSRRNKIQVYSALIISIITLIILIFTSFFL
ncbi:MAG: hypothetical protein GX432_11950 [Candidatus Atribacteria bacterium]|nr:hypothetical protein [Candidatus Atribacteria bacterium]